MAAKLINGQVAAAAQRLVWGDVHGAAQSSNAGVHTGRSVQSDAELARAVLAQQARIQELEREMEQSARQAHQQGFAEGQAAGAQQAAARLEPAMVKVAESIRELAAVRKRYFAEAEGDAVKLAVAVARKVLHRELSVDPDALVGVVKAAFERTEARDVHRIRLHPEDQPVVLKHLSRAGVPPQVELIPDGSLERGAVMIETSRGCLDASVSSQLKEIERGLVDLVRRDPG
jgi:flagellar assembly protein FliH